MRGVDIGPGSAGFHVWRWFRYSHEPIRAGYLGDVGIKITLFENSKRDTVNRRACVTLR